MNVENFPILKFVEDEISEAIIADELLLLVKAEVDENNEYKLSEGAMKLINAYFKRNENKKSLYKNMITYLSQQTD